MPNKVSADQDPKGVIANYRNFDKESQDRNNGNHERGHASEAHLHPQNTVAQSPMVHRVAASVQRAAPLARRTSSGELRPEDVKRMFRMMREQLGAWALRAGAREARRSELLLPAASRLNRFPLAVSQSFRVVAPGWEICMSPKRHEPARRWKRETPSSQTRTTDLAGPPMCSL